MSLGNNNTKGEGPTLESIYKHWKNHTIFSNVFNVIAGIAVYIIGFGALAPEWGKNLISVGVIVFIAALVLLKIYKKSEQNTSKGVASSEELQQLELKLVKGTISADLIFYIGLMHFLTTNTLLVFIVSLVITFTLQFMHKPSFSIAT